MSDTTHDIAGLIDQMTQAIDAVRPSGVFSSNSKLSAALFALYEAMPALTDLQAERDALKARAEAAEAALVRAKVGLVQARDELDQYSRQEYPLDHPVHERYRQRDYDANPARLALDALNPPLPH